MNTATDWLSVGIAGLALALSAYATVTARSAQHEAKATAIARRASRYVLAETLASFHALIEDLRAARSRGELIGEHDVRIEAMHELGRRAVQSADATMLPLYDRPLPRTDPIHALEDRAYRLREVLDRL